MGAKSASECLCTIRSKLPTVFFSYFLGAYVVIALCNEACNKILLVHYCPFESTEESYKSVKKSKFSFFQGIFIYFYLDITNLDKSLTKPCKECF